MKKRLVDWAQLVRLPNVFTVIADVAAAFLLVSGGAEPIGRFVCILLSGICLYWAGMILNDVFDVDRDREERPNRPLASGAISLRSASIAGWVFLAAGVALATAAGQIPSGDGATTLLPAAIAGALAVLILLYDGPLKETPVAPAAMGGCRVLSFLLGASPLLIPVVGQPLIPKYLVGIALGFGVYIMGITTMARDEATGGNHINLRTGFVSVLLGAVLMALAPGLGGRATPWAVNPGNMFPVLIGMIVFPVLIRGLRVQSDPTPERLGETIRAGVLTIIPLAACFAFLGAGQVWGLAVFALVVPAILLSARLRVT